MVAPVARGVATLAITVPLMKAAESATSKIDPARAAAQAKFPDPTPPTTSADLRAVANRENDLFGQRKAVDDLPIYVKRSSDPTDENNVIRQALEDDKVARIKAIDNQRIQLRESPEWRTALDGYNRDQQAYKQAVIDTQTHRAQEQSRLEDQVGVTLFERVIHKVGPSMVFLIQAYSAAAAGAIPFALKRGAWPFPEKTQYPPHTSGPSESNPQG